MAKLDRQLARVNERVAQVESEMAAHLADHERLAELGRQASELQAEHDELEMQWLAAAELVE